MPYTVSLIYGSVRSNRKGIRAARYLEKKLKERNFGVHFIDPLEYNLPLLDKRYFEYGEGQAPELMESLATKFKESDGFILVSGEYNHGLPPALKNLLDHFLHEFYFKPCSIVSYSAGRYGGVRASVQLREVAGGLGMPAIPGTFTLPGVGKIFKEDGTALEDWIDKAAKKFLDEFEWYLEALQVQR